MTCEVCQLEGPLCPACGLPKMQHTSPDANFSTCADAINYRIKRAAAYWEAKSIMDLTDLFDKKG